MTVSISIMEPLLPTKGNHLKDLARDLVSRSAAMGGGLHPDSQKGIIDLLRLINSYYSNLIEGNSTHPFDIERAMKADYETDSTKRDLQIESMAHINCQKQIEERLQREPETDPSSPAFIRWIHETFYDELPASLKTVKHTDTDEVLEVTGGELRQRDIEVGSHVGPPSESIEALLNRFGSFYKQSRHHGITPIIAAAAAHHRLMWIHPFLDGNGRATRLYTDACLQSIPVNGYGLWSVSRGLARNRDRYMKALTWADAGRKNDTDGRGNLSEQGLIDFCEFFLKTCLDQIEFMDSLLGLNRLMDRIAGYVRLRQERIIPDPTTEYSGMKPDATVMLQQVLLKGKMSRGDIAKASGRERTGRTVLAQLLAEGILISSTPKGPVSLNYPIHLSNYLLPDLYPAHIL